jgi:tRNA(adenine34) deaminase
VTGYAAAFEPAMRLALAEAAQSEQAVAGAGQPMGHYGPVDVPVGAVILDEAGTVISRARNRREADRDPTAGAVTAARLGRLVYGAEDPKAGAVGSLWDVVRDARLNHRPEVVGGVLASECGAVLREFFAARRQRDG